MALDPHLIVTGEFEFKGMFMQHQIRSYLCIFYFFKFSFGAAIMSKIKKLFFMRFFFSQMRFQTNPNLVQVETQVSSSAVLYKMP